AETRSGRRIARVAERVLLLAGARSPATERGTCAVSTRRDCGGGPHRAGDRTRQPYGGAATAIGGREEQHGAGRLSRPAGAKRVSTGDPPAGRPLDCLHRTSP